MVATVTVEAERNSAVEEAKTITQKRSSGLGVQQEVMQRVLYLAGQHLPHEEGGSPDVTVEVQLRVAEETAEEPVQAPVVAAQDHHHHHHHHHNHHHHQPPPEAKSQQQQQPVDAQPQPKDQDQPASN